MERFFTTAAIIALGISALSLIGGAALYWLERRLSANPATSTKRTEPPE